MLAWLSREQTVSAHVANVRDNRGRLLSDPGDINSCFASYYAVLYSSRVRYSQVELHSFLETIKFSMLSAEAWSSLVAPFTLKEIQVAVTSMQAGRTPGEDGLPAEFFKTHRASLESSFREILLVSLKDAQLPPFMLRAVIVVIPKPGKDLCSSYRPISLPNVDVKILTKVLANQLNRIILSLIHGDQTEFMPGKGNDINLRWLFAVIDRVAGGGGGQRWLPPWMPKKPLTRRSGIICGQ